jgi:hypothetical protein
MKDFHNVYILCWLKIQRNQMLKKLHYYISYNVVLKYICAQKQSTTYWKKNKCIKKMIEMILNFMKFVLCTKHCDSIWLE